MAKNNSTIDRIQAVWNMHGGEKGIDRLMAGKSKIIPVFKTWKTLALGVHKSWQEYRTALSEIVPDGRFQRPFSWPEDISQSLLTIELVRVLISDLGFESETEFSDVYRRALECGLELCPAETGLALRLQYKSQPVGEVLMVASKPFDFRPGEDSILAVSHVSRELNVIHWRAAEDGMLSPDAALVFCKYYSKW